MQARCTAASAESCAARQHHSGCTLETGIWQQQNINRELSKAKLAKMQPPSCAHCAPPHAELTDTPAALQTHVPNSQPHHTRRNAPGLSQQFSSQCASQSRIMVHTRERLRRSAATHAPAQSGGWYRERTPTQPQLTAAAATAGVLNVICMAHQVR